MSAPKHAMAITQTAAKPNAMNGRKHFSRYADGEATRNELIHSYRKGARKRNHAFELTIEENGKPIPR